MPDLVNGAAKNQIADQSMAMAGHGDEIAIFLFSRFQNFLRRFTHCELARNRQPLCPEFFRNNFQIRAVSFDFLGLGELELVEIARGETVGDVKQQQFGFELLCQFSHMRNQAFIRPAVLQRD